MKNPIQPLEVIDGIVRFKQNEIIKELLDHSQNTGLGLNDLAIKFNDSKHNDDFRQLAQLIGYSLSGYGDLSYVSNYDYDVASAMADDEENEKDARISYLENELMVIKMALRYPVARLFEIHPDDLN